MILAALSHLKFFQLLDDEIVMRCLRAMEYSQHIPGDILCQQGEDPTENEDKMKMFFIISGSVSVHFKTWMKKARTILQLAVPKDTQRGRSPRGSAPGLHRTKSINLNQALLSDGQSLGTVVCVSDRISRFYTRTFACVLCMSISDYR